MNKIILLIILSLGFTGICLSAPPIFENNYKQAIQKEGKILIIFSTDWCGHCKTLKKDMDSLNLDDYTVCMINPDVQKDLRKNYKINSYPTSVILEKGKEVARKSGYEKNSYQTWLQNNK